MFIKIDSDSQVRARYQTKTQTQPESLLVHLGGLSLELDMETAVRLYGVIGSELMVLEKYPKTRAAL